MIADQNQANQRRKIVLIVEDSPVQALALVKVLECEKLNVLCASNGKAGLSMAQNFLPDIIILDIQMPEMDGLEVCKQLKIDPRTNAIPVVLLTAHMQESVFQTAIEEGAVDFIPKDSFSDIVLLETLKQLHILPLTGASEQFEPGPV